VAALCTLIVRLSSVPVPKAVPTAVVVPLHVTIAPLVEHTAQASEPINHAAAKTTAAMLCDTRGGVDELLHRCGNEFRERPPARVSSKILDTLHSPPATAITRNEAKDRSIQPRIPTIVFIMLTPSQTRSIGSIFVVRCEPFEKGYSLELCWVSLPADSKPHSQTAPMRPRILRPAVIWQHSQVVYQPVAYSLLLPA